MTPPAATTVPPTAPRAISLLTSVTRCSAAASMTAAASTDPSSAAANTAAARGAQFATVASSFTTLASRSAAGTPKARWSAPSRPSSARPSSCAASAALVASRTIAAAPPSSPSTQPQPPARSAFPDASVPTPIEPVPATRPMPCSSPAAGTRSWPSLTTTARGPSDPSSRRRSAAIAAVLQPWAPTPRAATVLPSGRHRASRSSSQEAAAGAGTAVQSAASDRVSATRPPARVSTRMATLVPPTSMPATTFIRPRFPRALWCRSCGRRTPLSRSPAARPPPRRGSAWPAPPG
jgi:hypothetical protein